MLAGTETPFPQLARKLLRIIPTLEGHRAAGMHLVRLRDRTLFFADTTLNIAPDAETLASIAIGSAEIAKRLEIEPVVGMVSFENFGESAHPEARKVADAVRILRARAPELPVIGEIQADLAVQPEAFPGVIPAEHDLGRPANVLVFPNLSAANAAFRLVRAFSEGEVLGPLMHGLSRAAALCPGGMTMREIVRMAAIAGLEARALEDARNAE
jgi:malate dehydrogenase (oxaloacetate-decarboxylating)(NADP+)